MPPPANTFTNSRVPPGNMAALAFSPDGRRIATASWTESSGSCEVKLWDSVTGHEMMTVRSAAATRSDVELWFTPDGNRLMLRTRLPDGSEQQETWDGTPKE